MQKAEARMRLEAIVHKQGLLNWLHALFFLAPSSWTLYPLMGPDHPSLNFPLIPLQCPHPQANEIMRMKVFYKLKM